MLEPLLDAIPPVRGKRGRPRYRPGKLQANKGYDYARCPRACTKRRIKHRIARKGIESSGHLGKHRWVVERTFAWLSRFRRLTIRYERRADIHLAFTILACAMRVSDHLLSSPDNMVLKPALNATRSNQPIGVLLFGHPIRFQALPEKKER